MANIFSNRLAPSRDISTHFFVLESLIHLSSGAQINGRQKLVSSFINSLLVAFIRAGDGLMELFQSKPFLSFIGLESSCQVNKHHGELLKVMYTYIVK